MKTAKSSYSMPLLLAALLAGGGVLAATAYAMPFGGADAKPGCEARQGQDIQSRMHERHEQRMSALKEKLKLAPQQEAAWNELAASLQPTEGPAMQRKSMRGEPDQMTTVERIERMQAMAEARHARMAERAEAVKAFYSQLTPEQQKVFDSEALATGGHDRGGHRHGRNV